MFEQIGSLDKKTRNQWLREGATILAVLELANGAFCFMCCALCSRNDEKRNSRSQLSLDLCRTRKDVQHQGWGSTYYDYVKPGEDLKQRERETHEKFLPLG